MCKRRAISGSYLVTTTPAAAIISATAGIRRSADVGSDPDPRPPAAGRIRRDVHVLWLAAGHPPPPHLLPRPLAPDRLPQSRRRPSPRRRPLPRRDLELLPGCASPPLFDLWSFFLVWFWFGVVFWCSTRWGWASTLGIWSRWRMKGRICRRSGVPTPSCLLWLWVHSVRQFVDWNFRFDNYLMVCNWNTGFKLVDCE